MAKIDSSFFQRDPVVCARELIGCTFFWNDCAGRIVETEAYNAIDDEACHTWFRPSARKFVEEHQAGDAYVYVNYGVHWLFNILVKGAGITGFVLIRALEPQEGLEKMRARRGDMKNTLLTAGPGRLTQAFGINGADHGQTFLDHTERGILRGESAEIAIGPRIGISKAVDLQWRFGEFNSKNLSKKFK